MPPEQKQLVHRWHTEAHAFLDKAVEARIQDRAGDAQRWTIQAGIATDKFRDLDGKPLATVQHIHTIDLGTLAAYFAVVARRFQPSTPAPDAIDASFVPLQLPLAHGGAVGQPTDVGIGSGVPRPQAASPKIAAVRRKPRGPYGRRKTSTTIDVPGKELTGARHRMRIRAAKLAAKAAKANGASNT